MRSVCFCTLLCCVAVFACVEHAPAVGYSIPGKDECSPTGLEARGKVPDVLNRLADAFVFPSVFRALDKLAGEVKAVLGQFGVKTSHHYPLRDTETKLKSRAKKIKKPRRFKKVKRPPRAM